MTDHKICPICSTENPIKINKCKNCGFLFMDSSAENTDWLDTLRSEKEITPPTETFIPSDKPEPSPQKPTKTNQENAPDWLTRIREKKEIEENFSQVQRDTVFPGDPSTPTKAEITKEDLSKEDSNDSTPDWLSEMRSGSGHVEENLSSQSKNDLPDWLSGINKEQPINSEEMISAEEDLPDWLSNISSQNEFEAEEEKNKPNWFVGGEMNDESEAPISPFGNFQIDVENQEELPDWLKSSSDLPEIDNGNEVSQVLNNEPDWLEEITELNQLKESEEKSEETEPFREPLASFTPEPFISSEFIIPPFSDSEPTASTSAQIGSSENQEIKQDISDGIEVIKEDDISFPSPFHDDQLDDIEKNDNPVLFIEEKHAFSQPKNQEQFSSQPFTLDDMPDWLEDIDKIKSDQSEEIGSELIKTNDDKLQPGSLPGWLKAMRPVSAVAPNEIRKEDRNKIEKSGPLAGLQGVLSSETAINHYIAPPTYASKVNVTDKNKIHSRLLEEVFSQDKLQKPKTQKKSRLNYTIIRILIPFLLILGLIFSFFSKTPNDSILATQRNLPAAQFASIANALATTVNDAPHILIVMDSDAASMGELELITKRTFETFMIQNSWMVIVGTNPTGLMIAEEMVDSGIQNITTYNATERIINLGYLPGNETGIQGFISNPKLMIQKTKDGRSIWEYPGLINIMKIDDFDSIWIISDNGESTQKWIEQLYSSDFDKPILVSATTQATPMLSAYLKAGQFDGMIGGLPGAAAYDQLTTNSSNAFSFTWKLYQSAIFMFLMIILTGVVIQILESTINSKNK